MPLAIPAIVLVQLAIVVSFLVLYALRQQAAQVFGGIFHLIRHASGWVARIIHAIPFVGDWLSGQALKLTHWMERLVSETALELQAPIANFFDAVAAVVEYVAFSGKYVAEGALNAFYALRHVVVPRLIHLSLLPERLAIRAVARVGRFAVHEIYGLERALGRDVRWARKAGLAALATALTALHHTITVTLPHTLDWPRERIGELGRALDRNVYRRLTKLEKLLGAAVFAGLVARILAKRLPWYRCSNVDRAARQLCRTPVPLLESLLADTLTVIGAFSLVEFAEATQGFTGIVEDAMRVGIRELREVS